MGGRSIGWSVIAGVMLAAGGACGGGGVDSSGAAYASFEGIYQLDAATNNPSACDAEGPSILDTITQQQFAAVHMKMLTVDGLLLVSCADDAGCSSTASMIKSGGGWLSEWGWFMSEIQGTDQLGGLSATGGFELSGSCTSRSYTALTLTRDAATQMMLRLENRTTALADMPADNGVCWSDPSKERSEAGALPCSSLQVLTGSKRASLP
jgi:hypothetical protein